MSTATSGGVSGQGALAAALLDPALPAPAGLRTWNGSDPLRRLAVYRNNVVSSLVDALADTFPVTQALVGPEFFRAMAAAFVRRHPPRSCILAHYGDEFGDFIARFEPAAALPYLPDMAHLEHARLQACHAADAPAIAPAALAQALADSNALAGLRLVWQPSLRVIVSPFAVVSLWAAHQTQGGLNAFDVDPAEQALVLRDGLDVLVLPAGPGLARFVTLTQVGAAFGAAAAEAIAFDADFDLGAGLSLLLHHGALVALHATAARPSTSRTAP